MEAQEEGRTRRRGNKLPAPTNCPPPPPPKTKAGEVIYREGTFGDKIISLDGSGVKKFPYDCIGILKFLTHSKEGWKESFGTGFLIDADLVLTVASNIYNRNEKRTNKDIKFYPGPSGDLEQEESEDRLRVRAYGI